jgi:transcription-repair coupling factor (superfamily II helicase)
MTLSGLLPVITADSELRQALDQAAALPDLGGDLIAPAALRPLLVAALTSAPAADGTVAEGQSPGGFALAVTATAREAEELAAALSSLIGEDAVGYFPAWETLPHERLSPRSDTSGQRLAVLRRLAHPDDSDPRSGPLQVVTTPVRSLLQPMVPGLGELAPVRLSGGQEASLDDTVTHLVDIGYARVEMVERRGEIAVRGGLLDVFPPTEEHPLRVEFWGDEIEEIRYFKAADQRSLANAEDGLWAPPCRELLLTPSVRDRARQLAAEWPGLGDILGKMAEGITVEGMEALAPALTDKMDLLLDYLPRGRGSARVRTR